MKSIYYTLVQLCVTQAVLMEVPVLLLVHVPVFLNGLEPLVQLVRLHTVVCKCSQSCLYIIYILPVESDVDYSTQYISV